MERTIKRAVVLGAGAMGKAIAAHLANVGIPSYLLDMVPRRLTEEEAARGLTLDDPVVRNRLAAQAVGGLGKASPAPLFLREYGELITPGNFEDHLDRLAEADWIIEAVVERLDVKRGLLQQVEAHRRPGTIVSSNTSGISVNAMAAGLSEDFRQHFLGTHFFNPPRYMHLLELVPARDTRPEVVEFLTEFGRRVLGKGVVLAKDTPNFIANRVGIYGLLATVRAMMEEGLTVAEVDALTGPVLGRPKTASFRTADLVGLDVILHVAANVRDNVADPAERAALAPPEFLERMVVQGLLGTKSGAGFYRKADHGDVLSLDYRTMEYTPRKQTAFPSLELAKGAPNLSEKLRRLVYAPDAAGRFTWKVLKHTLLYVAAKLPEIAGDLPTLDKAMRWGFNWELGPFETWDAIGLEQAAARMRAEGDVLPPLVEAVLAAGKGRFYLEEHGRRFSFDPEAGDYVGLPDEPGVINLDRIRRQGPPIKGNAGSTFLDLGDGVAGVQLHGANDALGPDTIAMLRFALEETAAHHRGLVIGGHGRNFAVGANLMLVYMEALEGNWEDLDYMVRRFQEVGMAMKYCPKPVVVAPFQMTLGGGCELALSAHHIQAAAETYVGLVEVGVGLIPAGGGTKEMLVRVEDALPATDGFQVPIHLDRQSLINRTFELIATARVATSAHEARRLGYLRPGDGITVNGDLLLHDAREVVLRLAAGGFRPPSPSELLVTGRGGRATLEAFIYNMREGGYISDHDLLIANKLARVLTGGELSAPTRVSEQYILDLEREAFLSLLGERKTLERIQHTLKTGKPLRN